MEVKKFGQEMIIVIPWFMSARFCGSVGRLVFTSDILVIGAW